MSNNNRVSHTTVNSELSTMLCQNADFQELDQRGSLVRQLEDLNLKLNRLLEFQENQKDHSKITSQVRVNSVQNGQRIKLWSTFHHATLTTRKTATSLVTCQNLLQLA